MKKNQYVYSRAAAQQAMDKYHARYDNAAYTKAIEGKTSTYANALTDEALALCGHPYYKLSHRYWSQAALEYLARFDRTREPTKPKVVEFRLKVPTVSWKDIPVCLKTRVECYADAVLIARTLNTMNKGYEVRFNYEGSQQGHYVA